MVPRVSQCSACASSIRAGAMSAASIRRHGAPKDFHPEARRLDSVRPAVKAGLRHEVAHEVAGIGELPPDARQEQRPTASGAENEAVAIRLERSCEFGLARRGNTPGMGRIDTSRLRLSSSSWVRGGKRGSEKPACTAFAIASSIRDRRGAGEPMQPLSFPLCVRVTKVARREVNAGDRRPSSASDGARPPRLAAAASPAIAVDKRRARSASQSRAEAAYSTAKAP